MMTSEAPDGTTPTSGKNRWFQLGLLSAGAAAPLIARWRSLRAAEQAEALRNQASARWSDWSDVVSRMAASLPTDSIQGSIDSLQESLRQVAPQAQESLRQVRFAARDALQRLPGVNLPATVPPAPIIVAPVARRRANTTLWLMGVGVGVVAAGAVAYFVLRNRMSAESDDDTLVEIPLTSPAILAANGASAGTTAATRAAAQAASKAADEPPIVEGPSDDEPRVAEPIPFSESDAEGAAFVGNILSRIYHPIDSKRLPSPQNRIYFASEAEATSAGYRADSAELASRSTDASEPGE
jgi:hypothetical protein